MSLEIAVEGHNFPSKPLQLPDKSVYETNQKEITNVLRFVTFNVNSVATVLQYYPMTKIPQGIRSLNTFFNWMEADIICLQELKICNPIISSVSINATGGTKLLQQHGILSDYRCFVTLPKLKKSYSGVGIYIKKSLPINVIKVEEGITGLLPVNSVSINDYKTVEDNNCQYLKVKHFNKNKQEIDSYRTHHDLSIGGYEDLDNVYSNDIERAFELDNQGRCIITEFNSGLIVIGCYIPANSQLSEEGLLFKMQYLKLIFKRIENLQKSGKTVILMGDLNVCKDIIDREESLQLAQKYYSSSLENGIDPQLNYDFIKERPERFFFNQQLVNSSFKIEESYKGLMLDTTRYKHPGRKKMYTCWNTLTNARSVNYGSRIDYILISKNYKKQQIKLLNSDILPAIQGSDHCPVFTDFEIPTYDGNAAEEKGLKFECKNFYKLMNNDIMKMFGTKKSSNPANKNPGAINSNKVTKWRQPTSKTANKIDGFFKKKTSIDLTSSGNNLVSSENFLSESYLDASYIDEDEFLPDINSQNSTSSQRKDFIQQKLELIRTDVKVNRQLSQQNTGFSETLFIAEEEQVGKEMYDAVEDENELKKKKLKNLLSSSNGVYKNIPVCKHNEKAIIKISQTKGVNKGKKFWCCSKPLVFSDVKNRNNINANTHNADYSCGYFKWVT